MVKLGASVVGEGRSDDYAEVIEDRCAELREVGVLAVPENMIEGVIVVAEGTLCDGV